MNIRHVTILVIALFLIGCSTVQTNWVDESGKTIPDPHYTLNPIGTKMVVTFFYATVSERKDIDGTSILSFQYLDMMKKHNFCLTKYENLCLIIQVYNPEQLNYSLNENMNMKVGKSFNSSSMQMCGKRRASILPYRSFVYNLPFEEDIVEVDHSVILKVDDQEVMHIGTFHYHLIN